MNGPKNAIAADPPAFLESLGAVASGYDALLCDAWGVIHDGRAAFPGVADALSAFRRARGPVIVLTNAPKPANIIPGQLDRIGLPRDAYDAVVTSGDTTRAEIMRHLPARAHRIGWMTDSPLYEGLDIEFAPIDDAGLIICTGLADDGPADPEGYKPLLEGAAQRRVPMICANPDIVVRWNGRLEWCAGAVARVYEGLGGPVAYAGKPWPPIYALAFAKIEAAAGRKVDRTRVLAIGDGAATDILGANNAGVDCVYIANGKGVHDGDATSSSVASALADAGARADYWMTGLR